MDQFQIQSERFKLNNLHYWITYSGLSCALIAIVALFSLDITLIGMIIVAVGFSVYIIQSLIRLEKKGWVIGYAIFIGIPSILALILSQSEIIGLSIWFFPLVMFYIYCWILRYTITEWLTDLKEEKAIDLDQKIEKPQQDILDRLK